MASILPSTAVLSSTVAITQWPPLECPCISVLCRSILNSQPLGSWCSHNWSSHDHVPLKYCRVTCQTLGFGIDSVWVIRCGIFKFTTSTVSIDKLSRFQLFISNNSILSPKHIMQGPEFEPSYFAILNKLLTLTWGLTGYISSISLLTFPNSPILWFYDQ